MSFQGFSNSLSEEVTDLPKTNHAALSKDDYDATNAIKFSTKFAHKTGTVKLNNTVTSSQTDGGISFNIKDDSAIEVSCPWNNSFTVRQKVKPTNYETHIDFGQRIGKCGSKIFPYFRLNLNNDLTHCVPGVGAVFVGERFKLHNFVNLKNRVPTMHHRLELVRDNLLFALSTAYTFKPFARVRSDSIISYTHNGWEFSGECVKTGSGFSKPDFTTFNVAKAHGNMTFGGQVFLPDGDIRKKVLRCDVKTTFGKDLWFKTSVDTERNSRFAGFWKMCPGATVGASFWTRAAKEGSEAFQGYLNYPFNFGLNFKFDA